MTRGNGSINGGGKQPEISGLRVIDSGATAPDGGLPVGELARLVTHLRGKLRYDKFAEVITRNGKPLHPELGMLSLTAELQCLGFPKVGPGQVARAARLAADDKTDNPLIEWLDQQPAPAGASACVLSDCLGAETMPDDQGVPGLSRRQYLSEFGWRWTLAMVARAYRPGCRVEAVPVFVTDPGYFLADALGALLPHPGWLLDDAIDLRDAARRRPGTWLTLLPWPQRQRDREAAISFALRRSDGGKPRRNTVAFWSRDPVGEDRVWEVPLTGDPDVDHIVAVRPQIWGAARARFKQGDSWYLPQNLRAVADLAGIGQDDYKQCQINSVRQWLREYKPPMPLGARELRALWDMMSGPTLRARQQLAAKALRALGYEHRNARVRGSRGWFWWLPEDRRLPEDQGG